MAVHLPPASYFQEIVDEYMETPGVRESLGLSPKLTNAELRSIGESLAADIEQAYVSSLRIGGSMGLQYGGHVSINSKMADGVQRVYVTFNHLDRPSFEIAVWQPGGDRPVDTIINGKRKTVLVKDRGYWSGGGGHTGEGIDDIFALVTNGYGRLSHPVSGYWRSADTLAHAPMTRKGTPFVPGVIKKYEGMYPGLTITAPGEWGG